MAEYPGDATKEDIDKQTLLDLHKALAGLAGEDRTVTLTAAQVQLILENIPEAPPEDEEPKKAPAPKAAAAEEEDDDEDDDPGSTTASARRAAPRHRK